MTDDFKNQDLKCCICFPIATGMKIMGVLSVIQAVLLILGGAAALALAPIAAVIMFLFCGPAFFCAFQWFKWLRVDNEETRENVQKWMKIMILVVLLNVILNCVQLMMNKQSALIMNAAINGAINVVVAWYFWSVTVKYQAHKA